MIIYKGKYINKPKHLTQDVPRRDEKYIRDTNTKWTKILQIWLSPKSETPTKPLHLKQTSGFHHNWHNSALKLSPFSYPPPKQNFNLFNHYLQIKINMVKDNLISCSPYRPNTRHLNYYKSISNQLSLLKLFHRRVVCIYESTLDTPHKFQSTE